MAMPGVPEISGTRRASPNQNKESTNMTDTTLEELVRSWQGARAAAIADPHRDGVWSALAEAESRLAGYPKERLDGNATD